ncbi:5-oxoprolinase subunit PxpA [Flavilitoribacter nigricans]|uniref:Lactam utilization protein LamB n=1 Tax=Flavilitoribacter nigricans (strain ATCC 23147 / DSM 23189 / NBRC 102662 / NCIMB 1420 / SS-2) TaxID=1122177 RepID=A0A2D0NAC3_FLAN2|nr:5-oxoprolinase subunit PxpA [Flavilitoribacter nigricans]PHN05310.1 lactam utilization protein LamB [Flavilitoribacter nigricans DSM 23189 = NBRC 102662]
MDQPALQFDLNCDLGESYGRFEIGNDDALFPYLTSCNIACGFHGGDPLHLESTIQKAMEHQLRIGAHPSYPDLMGFGRRKMQIPVQELRAIVKYQVAALKGMVESAGGTLAYVKPHGALYNSMVKDPEEAAAVIDGIRSIDPELAVMGLAGSAVKAAVESAGMTFIAEAFADRRYTDAGQLVPRDTEGAVIHDPAAAAEQVRSVVQEGQLKTISGKRMNLQADSFCIHGDNPAAVSILQAIYRIFGITLKN